MTGAPCRFTVAMLGSRRHYAVPRILHAAGMLGRYITDFDVRGGPADLVNRALPASLRPSLLRRTAGRDAGGLPRDKVTALNSLGVEYVRRLRRAVTPTEHLQIYLWAGSEFARRASLIEREDDWGTYAFHSAALELFDSHASSGCLRVLEQTIVPYRVETEYMRREHERFPGWAPSEPDAAVSEAFAEREEAEWAAADVVLCGSDFVRNAVVNRSGIDERTRVVPYGFSPASVDRSTRHPCAEGPLRVLCVGASLRKGIGDLTAAARRVARGAATVTVVGRIQLTSRGSAAISDVLELKGPVPRSEMTGIYRDSDVLVQPSICEGSAMAVYEAMASGLPVIATPNAGTVVRDGIDGYVVPPRDPDAIAECVEGLASDRDRLGAMAAAARQRASEFSEERYGERLSECLTAASAAKG